MSRNVWKQVIASALLAGAGAMAGCHSFPPDLPSVPTASVGENFREFVQTKFRRNSSQVRGLGDPFTPDARTVSMDARIPVATGAGVTLESWVKAHGGGLELDPQSNALDISLASTAVTDSELDRLTLEDRPIRRLDLSGTDITDASISVLSRLKSLKVLKLDDTDISAFGAAQLAEMTTLEFVGLSETGVSDTSLRDLARLPELRFLLLDSTDISDAGLKELEQAKKLEGVTLIGTAVTQEGVKHLEAALPNCVVLWREEKQPSETRVPQRPAVPSQDSLSDQGVPAQLEPTEMRRGETPVFNLSGDWSDSPGSNVSEQHGADPFQTESPAETRQKLRVTETTETSAVTGNEGKWGTASEHEDRNGLPEVTPGRSSQSHLHGGDGFESDVTWSDDKALFAMLQKQSGRIVVFRPAHASGGQPLQGATANVKQIRFVDGNRRLIAVTANETGLRTAWEAVVWEISSGRREETLFLGEDVQSVSFVPGTTMIVVGRANGEQQVVDLVKVRTTVSPRVSVSPDLGGWRPVTELN